MTPVRFHNYVISSFLPASAHASMAQPCKLEAAFAWTKAENDRLSCRTLHTDWLLHSTIAIRQQSGSQSSQREDAQLLERQHQARLGDDRQEAGRESEGLTTALRTAMCEIFEQDF